MMRTETKYHKLYEFWLSVLVSETLDYEITEL